MTLRATLLLLMLLPALLLPGGARFCVCLMDGPLCGLQSASCCAEACCPAQLPGPSGASVSTPSPDCDDCHPIALERTESPRLEKQTNTPATLHALAFLPAAEPFARLPIHATLGSARLLRLAHAPPGRGAPVPLRI